METALISLICFTVAQQVIFFYVINVLLNKLMSKNFGDYVVASKELKRKEAPSKPNVEEFGEPPQDDLARVF